MLTHVTIPVHEVFPSLPNDFQTLVSLLRTLSRTDALITCARLNLIVSDPIFNEHRAKQQYFLDTFLTPQEIDRVNHFASRHGGADNVQILARGPLLELIQWICVFCTEHANDSETFLQPETRHTFAQALLIATELWHERVYGDRFSLKGGIDLARKRALGPVRQAAADSSLVVDPFRALGRGRRLFELLAEMAPDFLSLFTAATNLSLDEYYTCMMAIITHYWADSLNQVPFRERATPIIRKDTFLEVVPPLQSVFSHYIELEAQSPDDLRSSLWADITDEEAVTHLGRFFDKKPLRQRPILTTSDKRTIILDPVFYAEKASVGPLFHVLKNLPTPQADALFQKFGYAFETYGREALRRIYPVPPRGLADRLVAPLRGKNSKGSDVEITDACVDYATYVVLLELKGKWITDKFVSSEDHEIYLRHLEDKYGKGARQIAKAIKRLVTKEYTSAHSLSSDQRIIPVLVVHDSLLGIVPYPNYFDNLFRTELSPESFISHTYMLKGNRVIASLITMTIEDLENLETSTEHFALGDLLNDYIAACQDNFMSLNDFIASSKYGQQLRHNRYISSRALESINSLWQLLPDEFGDQYHALEHNRLDSHNSTIEEG